MTKLKTILVTGGFGYLGSHLVRKLLGEGFDVIVLDNMMYGANGLDGLESERLHLIQGDICSARDMALALRRADAVVALAAIVGDPACALDEDATLVVNYQSTRVLVELCEMYPRIQRAVFASSCSVYGFSDQLTMNEGSRLQPVSLYARTRIMSEKIILSSAAPAAPVILRLATLYGQSWRMRYDLVANVFAAQAVRDRSIVVHGGRQSRPMVHVSDAAEAFFRALVEPAEHVAHEVFNVGSDDQNYTIEQIAAAVKSAAPDISVVSSEEMADPRSYRGDFSKARQWLKLECRTKLDEGIREMIEHARRTDVDYRLPIFSNVLSNPNWSARP